MIEATHDEQVEALVAPILAKLDEVRAALNEYEARRLWGDLIVDLVAGRIFVLYACAGRRVCLYVHRGRLLYVRT